MKRIFYLVSILFFVLGFVYVSSAQRSIGTQLKTWPKLTESELVAGTSVKYGVVNAALLKAVVELKDNITPARLELTGDTSISAAQLLASKFITNQGSSAEIDITLPAVSYSITRTILSEEAQVIEVNPPTGEAFDLDGTTLDANDVVDSDATVGSKFLVTRMKNAAGAWFWSLDTVRGTWTDSGVSD